MNANRILENIRMIESGHSPQEDISAILRKHRCTAWLRKGYPDQPPDPTERLNKIAAAQRFKSCAPVWQSFHGIPYAVIKGAVLSQSAYGDASLRSSGDIDLLLNRCNLDKVKAILLQHGFVQGRVTPDGVAPFSRQELIFQNAMSHQTAPFIKETGNPLCPYVNVDINLNLFWGESPRKADMEYVLAQTQEAVLYGVSFSRLTPPMEFISLCMHHYKDMNSLYLLSEHGLRLDQFCDILYYLKNTPPDLSQLLEACKHLEVTDYLYYCVYYTNQVCPHPVLNDYLLALDAVKKQDLTPYYGLTDAERREWKTPFLQRLFDPDFAKHFYQNLSEADRQKVTFNRAHM